MERGIDYDRSFLMIRLNICTEVSNVDLYFQLGWYRLWMKRFCATVLMQTMHSLPQNSNCNGRIF